MSDQITLLEITDISKEGIGFKFHGLKHFNDKWFSWAAISKAILHREDEIIIDQKCTMPNYKQLQSQVEQLQTENARLLEWTNRISLCNGFIYLCFCFTRFNCVG